jgi:hypothetical protein
MEKLQIDLASLRGASGGRRDENKSR